ncbi:hypothetical protein [Uliginosibacterium sp. 31-12]|uniref:hypothetical protein n=1 Tax=Uliginosibacterium sp. 31-12 TaxID=3062781 RepID=UPI0026E315EC|nr:hypothetical protein [Uliginosibacterium sp. 31-12]MDO6388464.1 hypothetical protein [Uliginosibacterium sp. 31-12]
MNLELFIVHAFPSGIQYEDAVQLCLRLFCTTEGLPSFLQEQCTKDNLATIFSNLADSGVVIGFPHTAPLYGANHHNVNEKGHWVEIIASIFKMAKNEIDPGKGAELAKILLASAHRNNENRDAQRSA